MPARRFWYTFVAFQDPEQAALEDRSNTVERQVVFQASVEVGGRWIGIRKFLVHCTTVASVGSWKGKSLACLAAWEENVASFHSATPEHFPAATSDMCLLLGSSLWYCQLIYHIFLWGKRYPSLPSKVLELDDESGRCGSIPFLFSLVHRSRVWSSWLPLQRAVQSGTRSPGHLRLS